MLHCPFAALTMQEVVNIIDQSIQAGRLLSLSSVDAGKLGTMIRDNLLRASVLSSDLICADGLSLVWLSRLYAHPRLPERIAGIDLMLQLIQLAHKRGYKIYFFGSRQHVVEKTVACFAAEYSPAIIAGWHNGYYRDEEEEQIAEQIAGSGAHILFVALSTPKKEIFLAKYSQLSGIPFKMGVGGSFDVVAGVVRRAPLWMQLTCLEWLYRFIQEPRDKWKGEVVNSLYCHLMASRELLQMFLKKHVLSS